jgi:hypothetical protein
MLDDCAFRLSGERRRGKSAASSVACTKAVVAGGDHEGLDIVHELELTQHR